VGTQARFLQANAKSQYENLVVGNTNEYVYEFSMEYDVLDLLEQGFTKVPDGTERTEGIFCGGGVSKEITSGPYFTVFDNVGGISYSYDFVTVVQYKKFGVWFDLSSAVRTYNNFVTATEFFNREVVWEYEQNCRRGKFRSGIEGGTVNTAYQINGETQHRTVIYSNTRGLKYINMTARYSPLTARTSTGSQAVSVAFIHKDRR